MSESDACLAARPVGGRTRPASSDQLQELGVDRNSFDEGFADSGQVTAERGEVEALVGTLRETLTDIDAALAKFERGTYGMCENCGGPIAEARLEAMPMARLCIDVRVRTRRVTVAPLRSR